MEEIKEEVIETFENLIENLSQEDYRNILMDIISDLEGRLEAVEMEIENLEADS